MTSTIYPSLSDIEYPSLGDIKMKPKENDISKYIPRIDRTSKPMHGQKSINDTSNSFNPVYFAREKEKMYDQALQKEKEVLSIANELNRFVSTTTLTNDVDPTDAWYHKQSELEYKFFQKESELSDTITELNSVNQHEMENQMGTLQIDKQNPEMAEITTRLEAKRREFTQHERKVSETKQAFEDKMIAVRERQKRHLQVS